MNKDFVLPLDEIEVLEGELLMVHGGNTSSIMGVSDYGCGCYAGRGCGCDNGKGCGCDCSTGVGCGCGCNCNTPPPPVQVVNCGTA